MLKKDDFELIGKLGRTHGVRGEIATRLDVDIAPLVEADEPLFLMAEEQGLLIPMRVEGYRTKAGEVDLVKFEGIDDKTEAEAWLGLPLWIDRDLLGQDEGEGEFSFARLRGYTLYNKEGQEPVGVVERIDESTINILVYAITPEGEELILPLAEELILEIDTEKKSLRLEIPQGLLDDSGEFA